MKKKNNNEEAIKEFELNTKILKNFERIMSMKLDEVEILKITELDNGSKLLNIMSLCANLKTLIISGNLRLNTDQIIKNIFRAAKLEKLVLNDVKLPKNGSLNKCTNLKEISLDSIRLFDIKNFLENNIVNKGCFEILSISNSDMLNNSLNYIGKFYNLKSIELVNLRNYKLDDLSFIKRLKHLENLTITGNEIEIKEVNNILDFENQRIIDISTKAEKQIINLKINKKNVSELEVQSEDFSFAYKKINLYKIDKINIIINDGINDFDTIKKLLERKKKIKLILKNYSSLNIEEAEKVRNYLKIRNLTGAKKEKINIDKFIEEKKQIDEVIKDVNNSDTEIQKFLKVYKALGLKLELDETTEDTSKIECQKIDVAKILEKCLQCINIESSIIFGDDLENGEEHYWNQVKIDGKWYNVDLALDIPKIKKKKVEYCLKDDEDFYEFHTAKSGEKHYCQEEYNYKFINVFIKKDLFKEQLLTSYIQMMKQKIKKIFESNKKEKILALPSGDTPSKEKDTSQ